MVDWLSIDEAMGLCRVRARLSLHSILQFILRWQIVFVSRIAISRLKFKNYFHGSKGKQTDSKTDMIWWHRVAHGFGDRS